MKHTLKSLNSRGIHNQGIAITIPEIGFVYDGNTDIEWNDVDRFYMKTIQTDANGHIFPKTFNLFPTRYTIQDVFDKIRSQVEFYEK